MRFACDRCKTRYLIADERVRGKILKIRCKTCANVITVKEGMEAPAEEHAAAAGGSGASGAGEVLPAAPAAAAAVAAQPSWPERDRAFRPTTAAPQSIVGNGGVAPLTPAPKPALASAFASAMAEPQAPPQLEDEWYVSRDGEQQGPFGLHNAQAWVSQQPYEAELYCWCEGFDDWLPVDRIAHFRGLRSRPLPAAAASAAARAPLSGPLPALGRTPTRPTGASAASGSGLATVPVAAPGGIGGRAALAAEAAAASAVAPAAAPAPPADDKPQFAATMAALAGEAALPAATPPPGMRGSAVSPALPGWPGNAGGPGTPGVANGFGHAPGRGGFDAGDLGPQGFGADTGLSGRRTNGATAPPGNGAAGAAPGVAAAAAAPAASASASMPGVSSFDDELEFGEVSRVVRIADIGKVVRPPGRGATAPSVRRTGANEMLPAPGSLGSPPPSVGLGIPQPVTPAAGGELSSRIEPRIDVPLAVPAAQRRNHALLLGLVAVGLIGAGVAALFLLQSSGPEDPSMLSLSGRDVSDLTIRPDDPRRGSSGTGSAATTPPEAGSGGPARPPGGGIKRPGTSGSGAITANPNPGTGSGGKVETTPVTGPATPLGGDEVEEMSQRNSSGLQRCYEQALKKDIFLEVKSIKVTISIDTTGIVSSVAMSSHADHALGQCMIARIRNWRFRANSRGLDAKFTVAFGRT